MLLCPESEQFNPGKVFMFFSETKNMEILRHRTANLRLPHILFQTILTMTFDKAILKTDVAQRQLSNIFYRSHSKSPVSGAVRNVVFPLRDFFRIYGKNRFGCAYRNHGLTNCPLRFIARNGKKNVSLRQ